MSHLILNLAIIDYKKLGPTSFTKTSSLKMEQSMKCIKTVFDLAAWQRLWYISHTASHMISDWLLKKFQTMKSTISKKRVT